MDDVAHYRERFADPDFLFTPDGQFPLCYGEAGICHGELASAPIAGGDILQIGGGQAANAVPGTAWALVRGSFSSADPRIKATPEGDCTRIEAAGAAAHASLPGEGCNAIGLLVSFLLECGAGNDSERGFLELLGRLHGAWDGSGLGIACTDGHFGALTAVGSVIGLREGRLVQTVDFRYPTATSAAAIGEAVGAAARACGGSFRIGHNKDPFLMDPDSPEVAALLDSYEAATGETARPCTSKGGTYARCFTAGVCFGPEKPWEAAPPWVGGLHCADEGASEALLKEAFTAYALAIGAVAGI